MDAGNDVPDTPISAENAPDPPSEDSVSKDSSVSDGNNTANDILPDIKESSQSAEIYPERMDEDAPSSVLSEPKNSSSLTGEITEHVNTANINPEHPLECSKNDMMSTTLDAEPTLISEDKGNEQQSSEGQEHIDASSENVKMMEKAVSSAGSHDEMSGADLKPGTENFCEEKIGEASCKLQTKHSSDEPLVGPKDKESNNEPTAYLDDIIDKASVKLKDKESSDTGIASSEENINEVSTEPKDKEMHDEPEGTSNEKTDEASLDPKNTESSDEPIGKSFRESPLSKDHNQESVVGSKPNGISQTPKTSMVLESDNVLSDDMDSTPSETTSQSQHSESVPANDVNISIKLESIESLAGKSGTDHAIVDSTTPFIKSEIPEDVDMEKDADKSVNANGIERLDGVEDVSGERSGADEEGTVTMLDVLQEQEELEDDAEAVLGASDDKNCTYDEGHIKRQALYACLTCCSEASFDPIKRAGVCLACSLSCHDKHELIELYTKRNFRCDCGNPNFNNQRCTFTKEKTEFNTENHYNQNFSGLYCICHRPYPDPDSTVEDEMIQCIVCEDWLHSSHLDAIVPDNELYSEMICKHCMEKNEFLHDYTDCAVNIEENVHVDVVNTVEKINGHDAIERETITKENCVDNAEVETNMKELETFTKELCRDDAEMETSISAKELCCEDANIETPAKDICCDDAKMDTTTKETSHYEAKMETVSKELSEPETSECSIDQNETNIAQQNYTKVVCENSCSDDMAKDVPKTSEIPIDIAEADKFSSETTNSIQMTSKNTEEDTNDVITTKNTHTDDKICPTDTTGETVSASNTNDVASDIVDINNKTTENLGVPVEDSSLNDFSKDIAHTVDTNNTEDNADVNPASNIPTETCTTDVALEDKTEEHAVAALAKANAEHDNNSQAKHEQKDEIQAEDVETSKPENESHQLVEHKGDEMETDINLESNISTILSQDEKALIENGACQETTNVSGAGLIKTVENLSNKVIDDIKLGDDTIKLGSGSLDKNVSTVAINGDTEMSETPKEVDANVGKLSTETADENDDIEMTEDNEKKIEPSVNKPQELSQKCINTENSNKRKLSTEIIDKNETVSKKKSKLSDCKRPKSTKRFKGATFWPCSWRQKLCSCSDCVEMYRDKNVLFLLDLEDTITAYEELGKAKSDGKSSQYEKGLKALSSLDRIQQINALTEYNRMKEKLLEYLISFKDRQEVVKVEDVEKFFSNIKPKRKNDGVYFCR